MMTRSNIFICLFWICAFISCEEVPEAPPRRLPPDPPSGGPSTSPTLSPPVAKAGDDQVIYVPVLTTLLDGSKSTDPDNDIKSYKWRLINGNGASMHNAGNGDGRQVWASFIRDGIYQFELTVTDAGDLYSRDTIQVKLIDEFAPGVAPSFGNFCDTLVLPLPEREVSYVAPAFVALGDQSYGLNYGYTYKQISGPTSVTVTHLKGPTSREVSMDGLTKGYYLFNVEIERNGLKANTSRLLQVIEDTVSGKEYFFESKWDLSPTGGDTVVARTSSRREIFFRRNEVLKIHNISLGLDNGSWVDAGIADWMIDKSYFHYPDECDKFMNVYYTGSDYRSYAGKKVLIRVRIP
jgi:hypothetical protein